MTPEATEQARPRSPVRAPLPGPVVFIDGACLLCHRTVAFLAPRDRGGVLHFAPLQGELAADWLPPESRDVGAGGAVVFLEPDRGDRMSVRSAAVLRILGRLGSGWSVLAPLASIPGVARILDVPYRWIARNRDRWFGRDDACLVPSPDVRARFLEP